MRTLVVEDNPILRSLIVRLLNIEGIETEEACNGLQAIEFLDEDSPRPFALVVTDLHMPFASGLDVVAHLAGYRSAAPPPVILATGDVDALPSHWPESVRVQVLQKPMSLNALNEAVRRSAA